MGRLNEQGLQRLVGNIKEDVSSNIALVNTEVENAKGDILGIKNELTKSENTKYTTVKGVKEFECKDGYIDNMVIEGETLVNLHGSTVIKHTVDSNSFDFGADCTKFLSGTQITVFNKSNDKAIRIILRNKSNPSDANGLLTTGLIANESKIIDIPSTHELWTTRGGTQENWKAEDESLYRTSIVIIEGNHLNKQIPYFEGIASVGQSNKIDVLTYEEKINTTKISQVIESDIVKTTINDIKPALIYNPFDKPIKILFANNLGYTRDIVVNPLSSINITMLSSDEKINAIWLYFSNGWNSSNITEYSEVLFISNRYDKKHIPITLRSASSTVKDKLHTVGGKYYKTENCAEFIINGDIPVTSFYDVTDSNILRIAFDITQFKLGGKDYSAFVSDKISFEVNFDNKKPNCGFISDSGKYMWLFFDKSVVTQQNYKEYLNNNPIRFVAQKDPTIIEIPNFNPRTFLNKTTVLINSGAVQCEGSFEVTGSLVSGLEVMSDKLGSLDTVATNFRNIITSPELPTDSQGNDGDIWIKYI